MDTITIPAITQPSDLAIPCPDCEGCGMIVNPVWAQWYKDHPEWPDCLATRSDEVNERNYRRFKASQPTEPKEIPCLHCHGRGLRLTDLGKTLIRFMLIFSDGE